jgi:hypothetical protein
MKTYSIKGFKKLKEFVSSFEGDCIAKCFANIYVKQVKECSETVMFQTYNGKLISVYKSNLC